MRLTETEKQDILRYLDADKPLPEKYRFLLFEDKREVELMWNGKTNEVTNVVLPFQVIEQVDEPRSETTFSKEGKKSQEQGFLFSMDERGSARLCSRTLLRGTSPTPPSWKRAARSTSAA